MAERFRTASSGSLFIDAPTLGAKTVVLVVLAASTLLSAVVPEYWMLIGVRVLGGIAHGVFWALVGAYPARVVAERQIGRAISIVLGGGTIALIAPGTGLGEAFLVWDGTGYRAEPSEGGHADFAPSDAEQLRLLAHMRRDFDHVSYERVCSGIGIPNLYDFLRLAGELSERPEVAHRLASAADRTRMDWFALDVAPQVISHVARGGVSAAWLLAHRTQADGF